MKTIDELMSEIFQPKTLPGRNMYPTAEQWYAYGYYQAYMPKALRQYGANPSLLSKHPASIDHKATCQCELCTPKRRLV